MAIVKAPKNVVDVVGVDEVLPSPEAKNKRLRKEQDDWVNEAPDGNKKKWKLKGKKVVVTHTFDPEILEKLDELADNMGIKRAALINWFVMEGLKKAGEL